MTDGISDDTRVYPPPDGYEEIASAIKCFFTGYPGNLERTTLGFSTGSTVFIEAVPLGVPVSSVKDQMIEEHLGGGFAENNLWVFVTVENTSRGTIAALWVQTYD